MTVIMSKDASIRHKEIDRIWQMPETWGDNLFRGECEWTRSVPTMLDDRDRMIELVHVAPC